MIYLAAMDTDDDGRISWDEYRAYGEAHAANWLARQQAAQRAMLQAFRNKSRFASRNVGRGGGRLRNNYGTRAYRYQQQIASTERLMRSKHAPSKTTRGE